MNNTQLLLLDRTKWHEKRLLRFNIREILDRRETSTLQAMAALLHRDSICPGDGMPLLDTLDENIVEQETPPGASTSFGPMLSDRLKKIGSGFKRKEDL